MKRRNISLLALASLTLFTFPSCSEQDDVAPGAGADRTVSLAVSTATITRAADGIYTSDSGFTGTEQVQVYMSAAGSTTSATYAVSAATGGSSALTAADASATGAATNPALEYPEDASAPVTLYAVYPATSTASHTVAYDQSDASGYQVSDLMFATKNVSNRGETQALTFSHQLVKLKLTIRKPADVQTLGNVVLRNVKRQVGITLDASGMTLVDAASTGDANGDNILVASGETRSLNIETYTYACILPKTKWNIGDAVLAVTLDGQEVTYKLGGSDPQTLYAGKEYTLTLEVSKNVLGSDGTNATLAAWGSLTEASISGTPADANALSVTVNSGQDLTWKAAGVEAAVTVKNHANETLTQGTDYRLEYIDHKKVGKAYVVAIGLNTYANKNGYAEFEVTKNTSTTGDNVPKISFIGDHSQTYSSTSSENTYTQTVTNTGDGEVTYSLGDKAYDLEDAEISVGDFATIDSSTGEVSFTRSGKITVIATATNTDNCEYNVEAGNNTATYVLTVNKKTLTAEEIAGLVTLEGETSVKSGQQLTFKVKTKYERPSAFPTVSSSLQTNVSFANTTDEPAVSVASGDTIVSLTPKSSSSSNVANNTVTVTFAATDKYDAVSKVFTFTVTPNQMTAKMRTGDHLKLNPLYWVAKYNTKSGGSFKASWTTGESDDYVWLQSAAISLTKPAGYHLPTFKEQVGVVPSNSTSTSGMNIYSYGTSSVSTLSEVACKVATVDVAASTSYWKKAADGWLYGVRFVSSMTATQAYASAWRYKWMSGSESGSMATCNGFQVESYMLEERPTDATSAQQILDDLMTNVSTYFSGPYNEAPDASGESNASTTSSLCRRFMPACGVGTATGTASSLQGTYGGYWSSDDGFYWNFNSGGLSEDYGTLTYARSVRLFRDN